VFSHLAAPRRVVVTGMGIACPLGLGVENVWKRLTAGESGLGIIESFDVSQLTAKIAGQVPVASSSSRSSRRRKRSRIPAGSPRTMPIAAAPA
jgi:3-oxoacyl-[acyl-carrier-protein] synthase II